MHPGDTCPVCGNRVEANLREEDFQSALAPLQQELERKKKEKEQIEKKLIELQVQKENFLELSEKQKKKFEDDHATYRTTYQQTVDACAACGILQLQKETQNLINEKIQKNRDRQNEIGARIKVLQEQINLLHQKQQEKENGEIFGIPPISVC